eukprot:jgi/Botrbrau1/15744/Bobra.4_1s0112.1
MVGLYESVNMRAYSSWKAGSMRAGDGHMGDVRGAVLGSKHLGVKPQYHCKGKLRGFSRNLYIYKISRQTSTVPLVWPYTVPDISKDHGVSEQVHQAARALADSLTLEEVAKRTVISVLLAFFAAWLAKTILYLITEQKPKEEALDVTSLDLKHPYTPKMFMQTALKGLQEPANLVLPLVALMHAARTISCAIQIFLDRGVLSSRVAAAGLAKQAAHMLATVDNIFGDLTSVLTVVFIVWFLLSWRQHLVDLVVKLQMQKKLKGIQRGDLEKVFVPISSLMSWAVMGAGILCCLQILGVNISPLLAVGGISGIAIGFGAQAITSNAISAVNLMLDRPFVVGEEVKLQTQSGEVVVQGIVEEIQPMRTLIRNFLLEPIAIPNNMISEFIIVNESRLGVTKVIQDFADTRQLVARVNVKYEDAEKVPDLLKKLSKALMANPNVDPRFPALAVVVDTTDYGIELMLQVHANPAASTFFNSFRSDILVEACTIIAQSGAEFALRP